MLRVFDHFSLWLRQQADVVLVNTIASPAFGAMPYIAFAIMK